MDNPPFFADFLHYIESMSEKQGASLNASRRLPRRCAPRNDRCGGAAAAYRKSLFDTLRAVFRTLKSSENLLIEREGGLQATAASGGGKGAKKLGRHLALHKRSAVQSPSANPDTLPPSHFPRCSVAKAFFIVFRQLAAARVLAAAMICCYAITFGRFPAFPPEPGPSYPWHAF